MRRLFNFKYPKMLGLTIAIILAYIIFRNPVVENFISNLGVLNDIGIFIAGMFFSFGFTAPFAAGFFIVLNPQNILVAGIIGGIGAMISDLLIFKFIIISFENELKSLKKEKISKKIEGMANKTIGNKIMIYLMYVFAGILIASPLPDEVGVILLAGLTKVKARVLAIVGFVLNTIGILVLLYI